MIIRLSVRIPKAVTTLLNGLEVHVPAIAEHARTAVPGDPWTGWIVAQVESVEAGGRILATGEPTADVIITAVELMQDEDATLVRKLFNAVRDERLSAGSLTDPDVVGDEVADRDEDEPGVERADFDRAAARRRHPSTVVDNPDDPEGEARYAGRPLESVDLPAEPEPGSESYETGLVREGIDLDPAGFGRSARERAAVLWSPADDVAGAS